MSSINVICCVALILYLVQVPSPLNITVIHLNSTSVEVSWMTGNAADEVDNVTVEYSYTGQCNCSDQDYRCQSNHSTAATSIFFSNLQEHSTYSFTIVAFNQAGRSSPATQTVTTHSAS